MRQLRIIVASILQALTDLVSPNRHIYIDASSDTTVLGVKPALSEAEMQRVTDLLRRWADMSRYPFGKEAALDERAAESPIPRNSRPSCGRWRA